MKENTPTILLTFDKPSCPTKIELDYVTYHIERYVPNPLMCYGCGHFGHSEMRCSKPKVCLQCGQGQHEGECEKWCLNCSKPGHSCLARECEIWQREKEICRIKSEEDVSYAQARKMYKDTHNTPQLQRSYATALRTPSAMSKQEDEMKERVSKMEEAMKEMITLMKSILAKQSQQDEVGREGTPKETTQHIHVNDATSLGKQPIERSEVTEEQRDEPQTMGSAEMMESEGPECVTQATLDDQEREPSQSRLPEAGRAGDWKVVGNGKAVSKQARHLNKVCPADNDIDPSPVITRASRSVERGKRTQTVNHRKSWKDDE